MMWEERVESIKAGIVSASAVGLVFPVAWSMNNGVFQQADELAALQTGYLAGSLSGAIALFTGFLFGITYRYVIRQDPNLHLRSGAVLAFGLVRGLAQIDVGFTTQESVFPFLVLAGESLMLFAIARLVLDWAMGQKWVKPFP
ncbi:hypothetical protein [Myxacorys almedinensis]|uniref:Uncharacterized protein n=1 Tax=Myxacorys almedinensis A TaxID=2690445 RepID=A0A8J7Z5J7_9CYAN|nr:hypothetical protein [Myxacorys almedinensis]NDJ16828.1 hypothetical protein [Myxacorys almedinensis A]